MSSAWTQSSVQSGLLLPLDSLGTNGGCFGLLLRHHMTMLACCVCTWHVGGDSRWLGGLSWASCLAERSPVASYLLPPAVVHQGRSLPGLLDNKEPTVPSQSGHVTRRLNVKASFC